MTRFAALFLLCPPLLASGASSADLMESAADAFLASLTDSQRAKAALPFESDAREDFRYTPRTRRGLPLDEMNAAQRSAAMSLLEAALSEKGKWKAEQVILLEGVLREMEGGAAFRDPGKYHVVLFGRPGDESGWGWKFEGHHLSLNFTLVAGEEVAVTPSFMGANPREVREGEHQGLRVLEAEEDLARALVRMLLEEGNKEAVFSSRPPREIITGESREVEAVEAVGMAAAEMSEESRTALRQLIRIYVDRHRTDLAKKDLARIDAAGFERVHFGWAGGTEPGDAFYYRVQGPTFIMEAANTQNDANHIHTVWRNFERDFGRDLLREHLEQNDHGP